MADNNTNMNAQDIMKNMTVAEFRAYNQSGYAALLSGLTVQELKAHNPDLVDSIVESGKITEMQLTISGKQESVKITELQGKIDAYEQKITELQNAREQAELDAYKFQKITEMVDEAHVDAFMKRVSGKTKEDIDKSIDAEIAFVREMGGMNNRPIGRTQQKSGSDDIRAAVRNMFGVKADENK